MLELLKNIHNLFYSSPNYHVVTFNTYAVTTTIPAGAKQIVITTDSSYNGNLQGTAAAASTTYKFDASIGYRLPAIVVTRSAGNFTVIYVK